MKVTIKRSGGFAGISEEFGPYDTERFASDKRREVEALLKLTLEAAQIDEPPVGADFISIELLVWREGKSDQVAIVDDGDPARPVLEYLRELLEVLGLPSHPMMENAP